MAYTDRVAQKALMHLREAANTLMLQEKWDEAAQLHQAVAHVMADALSAVCGDVPERALPFVAAVQKLLAEEASPEQITKGFAVLASDDPVAILRTFEDMEK